MMKSEYNAQIKKKVLRDICEYLVEYEYRANFSLDVETYQDEAVPVEIEFKYRGRASDWVQTLKISYDSEDKDYNISIELYHCVLQDTQNIYYRMFKTITVKTIQNILNDHSSMFGNSYFE